ncbi:MAG: HD domain-containing protein [Pseudomonadota bacterium]
MPSLSSLDLRACVPEDVLSLAGRSGGNGLGLFLAGGTVRDIVLGRKPADIDLTVPQGALSLAEQFAEVTGGAYVLLDPREKTARVVLPDYQVDFTEFRNGSRSIEEDLSLRDLTINAMGVFLPAEIDEVFLPVIDPAGGYEDLKRGVIRFVAERSVIDDPLRMLRAYRFAGFLDFVIDPESRRTITRHIGLIRKVSAERSSYELNTIFQASKTARILRWMDEDGLLRAILPEIEEMHRINQFGYHHLDVYNHSLLTLDWMEKLQAEPTSYFPPGCTGGILEYLEGRHRPSLLKWAALFHDLGKPGTIQRTGEKFTFHNHDQVGSLIFLEIAQRLKWSTKNTHFVERLISLHMRPFHLTNILRSGELTGRAVSRLVRETEGDVPGLFLLAMADSLAGSGPMKPLDTEQLLLELFEKTMLVYKERLRLLHAVPRLVTGDDLINVFHLEPGPLFKQLLEELEDDRLAGIVHTRDEALHWLKKRLVGST